MENINLSVRWIDQDQRIMLVQYAGGEWTTELYRAARKAVLEAVPAGSGPVTLIVANEYDLSQTGRWPIFQIVP